ncbi:MAG: carboxypeptidase regulatory-like domain-containing protein, partial [Acidobacteria bacterium]|nr:carboxypeptidase regulatory-like domain-containing protein [Acidobacteriota bacterium]
MLAAMAVGWLGLATLCAQTSQPLQGRVLNGTTNRPVPNVQVEYIRAEQGMVPAGTATTDSQGRFRFNNAEVAAGPALLRVEYQGATYTQVLPPPTSRPPEMEIQVFDTSGQPGMVTVQEHIIFLEP